MRESLDLAMDAVPRHIDTTGVSEYLRSLPGVSDIHHLHIWAMSTTETALTVHLVTTHDPSRDDTLLAEVAHALRGRFSIGHPTIQIERGAPGRDCVIEVQAQPGS